MKNNKKKLKAPKLRFPEFTDDWEQRTIFEVADKFDNLRIPITASDRVAGNTPYYGANGIQDYVEGFTHDGEFVLVAEDGANNLQDYPVKYVNGKVWVNNHAHVLQGKIGLTDTKFLMSAIKNIDIEPFLVGGGRAKLNADVMMKLKLTIPSLQEQIKLGTFFEQVDHLITLHQRECDLIVKTKKSYLQKMFPKNGEDKPEIRFAGFTDAWEECRLGEVKDVRDGTHDSPKYQNKGFPLITSKNIKESGLDMSNVSLISFEDFNAINQRSKVDIGDIIFGMIGTIGNPIILERDDFAIKNVALLKNGGSIDNRFLLQLLKSPVFELYMKKENAGGTQKFLGLSQIRNLNFFVPELSEQQRIGEFFSQLDNLLILYQRKLGHLQEQKKSLLKQMFI